MKDDLAIARGVKLRKVVELAKERLGIDADDLEPYGHYKAKLSSALIEREDEIDAVQRIDAERRESIPESRDTTHRAAGWSPCRREVLDAMFVGADTRCHRGPEQR